MFSHNKWIPVRVQGAFSIFRQMWWSTDVKRQLFILESRHGGITLIVKTRMFLLYLFSCIDSLKLLKDTWGV
jgi:hypothetical protein